MDFHKIPYTVSPSDDSALTISLDGDILCSSANWCIDLTLSKGQHLPGSKGKRLFDLDYKKQRKYLLWAYNELVDRLATCNIHVNHLVIVYEIQGGTLNVHSHANACINTPHEDLFVQRAVIDILKHMGFNRHGVYIQGIKHPEERNAYLLKKATKLPPYISVGSIKQKLP